MSQAIINHFGLSKINRFSFSIMWTFHEFSRFVSNNSEVTNNYVLEPQNNDFWRLQGLVFIPTESVPNTQTKLS